MGASRAEQDRFRFIPGSLSTYRFSVKVIAVILGLSVVVGFFIQLLGYPMYGGMAAAMGGYLVLCSIIFITIPLILIDEFFD